MAAEPESGSGDRAAAGGVNWEVLVQVVGAGAALAGWIAVVGGGRVWARLHAADIPATQTLAVLPRDLLLVEGLQTLLAPLLIGALGALLVYYSWPTEAERDRLEDRGRAEWKKRTAAEADHSKQKDGDDAPPGMEPPGADADQGKQGESDNVRREAEPPTTGPPMGEAAASVSPQREADDEPPTGRQQPLVPSRRRTGQASKEPDNSSGEGPPDECSDGDDGSVADDEPAGASAARSARSRRLAPLLLVEGLIDKHGVGRVAAVAAACAVVLMVLALIIVGINWWGPLAAIVVAGVLVVAAVLREPGPGRAALLFAAALAPLLSVVVAVAWVVKPWAVGAMIAVTLVAAWVTLGALVNRSTRAIAVTLCVALALWAGALGFLRDVAAWHPHLERAVVEPKSGPTVVGFYLGGSGGDVYVASESRPRFVTLIRKDDVGTLQFGERVAVDQQARGNQDGSNDNEGAGGTGTTGTDTSGGGADGGSGSADDAVIPVSPEAARPDPTLRRVIATAYGSVDGVPLRLQIMEPRRGTSLMVLNLRLTSRDVADEGTPRRLIVGSVFDDGVATERSDMRDTVDGLAIADLDGKHRHTVARDDDGVCLCSRGLRQVALDPGQSVRLFATFAPAPTSGTFELQVDGFGDIPLATGPS